VSIHRHIIDLALALTHDPTDTMIIHTVLHSPSSSGSDAIYLMFIQGALCRPFHLRAKKVGSIPRPNGGALRCSRRDLEHLLFLPRRALGVMVPSHRWYSSGVECAPNDDHGRTKTRSIPDPEWWASQRLMSPDWIGECRFFPTILRR
jgi:hypothetical protein